MALQETNKKPVVRVNINNDLSKAAEWANYLSNKVYGNG
jgi:hypothetical protein